MKAQEGRDSSIADPKLTHAKAARAFALGHFGGQWQTSLPILKPLKPLYRLDLEWWAVQGSNL